MEPSDLLTAIGLLLVRRLCNSPQQLNIGHNVGRRPLEHSVDETLRLYLCRVSKSREWAQEADWNC